MWILLVTFLLGISLSEQTGTPPIALHQLITVNIAGDSVIRAKGYDTTNPNVGDFSHCYAVFDSFHYS